MSFSSDYFQKLEKNPLKINQYNYPEVKATLDDNLSKELSYKEDLTQFWTKTIVGYASCLVAGICALYTYITPFKDSHFWSAVMVAIYVVLSAYYQLFVYRNRDIVFVGVKKSDKQESHVLIIAKMKKPSPNYKLVIYSSNKKISNLKDASCLVMEQSVEKYFDEKGHFDILSFSQHIKQALVVNKKD